MNAYSQLQIDLRQMILAIESAVSLVGMNDTNHGKRVGYIAGQLAHQLGYSDQSVQYAFDLGLLHDCGVSTQQMHSNLVNHFDWQDAHVHCQIGHDLLKDFEPLAQFAIPILYHHTPWEELVDNDISAQDARMANLIFLADRIDILASTHYGIDILLANKEILHSINHFAKHYFDPVIVNAFNSVAGSEAFWIALEDRHIIRYTWDMGQIGNNQPLSISQIKQLSMIMSYIVDQKSPFTAQHSLRVSALAKFLAESYGLMDEQCEKIEIAGLLHDLGKLHTPDNILEKPGPLNELERSIMNEHSYETYEILRQIKGLGEIAQWASFHHECLNGAGYPFHPNKKDLSIEARVIAVADVFQALVQDRPYREGMRISEVVEILENFTQSGKLDQDIVNIAKKNQQECFNIAKGLLEK